MKLNEGLVYTKENCIGCNRCISGCPVLGANISVRKDGQNKIYVDNEKCLHCGRCLVTCHHDAREYRDDTHRFLEDLRAGEQISLLVAPSFFITYDKKAFEILGYLKELGANLIYDVSYGADIATWAYLTYLEEHPMEGAIAPPCSAVVNYIEKYSKELVKKLIPVQTPLLCLAVYIRKYCHRTDKLAFISPCIAKKDEIDDVKNAGLVSYNVTFAHLAKELEEVDVRGYSAKVECSDFGLGRLYPVPGGLSDNIRHFVSGSEIIREIHGERAVYDYFTKLEQRILEGKDLPFLVDCLNCRQGCLTGTATSQYCSLDDDIFFRLQKYREPTGEILEEENPYLQELPSQERQRRLKERFAGLSLKDFMREYTEDKYVGERHIFTYDPKHEKNIDAIFCLMHKETEESRSIDCHSCGYSSCLEMATAIYKGYNFIENCVHYVKDENLRISMIDIRSGIPNYNAYLNFTDRLIGEEKITEYSAIYFNISNFKFINQKFGFRQGDAALREYCAAVAELVTAEELMALTGGNNFVGVIRKERLPLILKELESVYVSCIREPVTGERVAITARIAVYNPDGTDTSPQMIMEKLSSTYDEINKGQNETIRYYDDKIRQRKSREDLIMHAIEPALKKREFVVYYQPKVDMKSRRIIGAEALIRWNHEGKLVPPMEFIPICENTGQVQKLDFYVLETVCSNISEWLDKGIDVVTISVNFSKHHFVENTVAERINQVAETYGIPKKYLEIEFTETAYLEGSVNLISSINKLHEFGISASMDDFGTGYSSLSMLQNMSFDTLKLDKSFLDNRSLGKERSRAVIGNIIRMAKELDMSIVSEGIETESELEYMKALDCDIAQGYLFDRPLTHDEFEQRLMQSVYE
ncbi:MAG: EAL domain-containing protein [Lachnospiraceae bacterium]|nr:EAL domain-containing protein [Lachnospiraceae bacterium]